MTWLCQDSACQRRDDHVHLMRLLLPMPSVVPVPDGMAMVTWHEYLDPDDDVLSAFPTLAALRRVETSVDVASHSGMDQMLAAALTLGLVDAPRAEDPVADLAERGFPQKLSGTVADVITPKYSPNPPPSDWEGHPADLRPDQDFMSRALSAIQPIIRAARLAGHWRVVVPTYELLPLTILYYEAIVPDTLAWTSEDVDWESAGLLVLEHLNFMSGRWAPDPETEKQVRTEHSYWMRGLASGTPAVSARETIFEAERFHRELGEYAAGVTLLWTGCEVLLDAFLSAILWEKHFVDSSEPDPIAAAKVYFRDGTAVQRAKRELPPLLGGDWSSATSAWVRAQADAYKLRNLVVHRGHQPTRGEAEAARDAVNGLQRFLFDRLASKAGLYPRAAHLLVGADCMERRGRLGGNYGRTVLRGDQEAPWLEAWGEWHGALVDELGR